MNNELLSVANTLKAGWLEIRLARLFGTKIEVVDTNGTIVIQALYRGRLYFMDYKVKPQIEEGKIDEC